MQISVVIPAYRAEATVERAVRSACQQLEVAEVIIVEDGSGDGTWEVCQRLATEDQRVISVQHEGAVNLGAGASRNLGMLVARSPYIAFLDADDHYAPDRFVNDRKVFEAHPDADGVYNAVLAQFEDEAARSIFLDRFHRPLTTVWKQCPPKSLFRGLVGLVPGFGGFHLDGLTLKRCILHNMDPWFRTDLRLHQDTDFIFRLAHCTRLYGGLLDTEVAYRSIHATNRITSGTDLHASRTLLFQQLLQWSSHSDVERDIRRHFATSYFQHAFASAPTLRATLSLTAQAMGSPWVLRNHHVREHMASAYFGKGSWLSRKLTVLSWWMTRSSKEAD
jgi:hypothetical protein